MYIQPQHESVHDLDMYIYHDVEKCKTAHVIETEAMHAEHMRMQVPGCAGEWVFTPSSVVPATHACWVTHVYWTFSQNPEFTALDQLIDADIQLCGPCCTQVLKTPVSRDMLGRIFNGSGRPIDGG